MAFTIDAVGFIFAILLLVSMRTTLPPARVVGSTWAAAVEGLSFLRHSPILLSVMSVDFLATFFGATTVLLPIVAVERLGLGADALGLLNSSIAVGALLGSIVVSLLPAFERPGRGVLVAVGIFGFAIVGFGLSTTLVAALAFLALSGAADAVSMAQRHTVRNLVTPDTLRGRISAAHSTFASGGPQLGDARAGTMAGLIGAGPALVFGGLGVIVTVILAHVVVPNLARASIRDLGELDDVHTESAPGERGDLAHPVPPPVAEVASGTTGANVR